jgi:hypothetical protein
VFRRLGSLGRAGAVATMVFWVALRYGVLRRPYVALWHVMVPLLDTTLPLTYFNGTMIRH